MTIPSENYSDTLFSTDTGPLKKLRTSQDALNNSGEMDVDNDLVEKCNQSMLYHSNGNLAYEGDLVGGQPWGEGKKYNTDGSLMYSGKFAAGFPHGQGTVFSAEGRPWIIGSWSKGQIVHGTKYFQKGASFVGSFLHGRINEGKLYNDHGFLMYQGQFSNEVASGVGTIFYRDCGRYEGMVLNGRCHGEGRTFGPNNVLLAYGIFKNDQLIRRF